MDFIIIIPLVIAGIIGIVIGITDNPISRILMEDSNQSGGLKK